MIHYVYTDSWSLKYCTHPVLFLNSENKVLGIIYILFRGRQIIFLIFTIKFVVKCATKILKINWQIKKLPSKIFLNKEFSTEK